MRHYLVDGKGIDAIQLSKKDSPAELNVNDVQVDARAWSLNYRDLYEVDRRTKGVDARCRCP